MIRRIGFMTGICLLAGLLAREVRAQDQVTLTPSKDNTIYEESETHSNGAGRYLFVGRTGGTGGALSRRALLHFTIGDSVSESARIDSVFLSFTLSRSQGGATEFDIYRLTADWGEAGSDAGDPGGQGAEAEEGDATWSHAFYDTETWETTGGDFDESTRATVSVSGPGTYTVRSTADLVADVQSWLDDPSLNFGWILVGDESTPHTARRLDGRDHPMSSHRPMLTVHYSEPTAAERPDHPVSFVLEGNHPNPFKSSTVIRYRLERPNQIQLTLYDVTGRPVKTVGRRDQAAGTYEVEIEAEGLASGLYIYCLRTTFTRECRTLTALR